MKLKIHELARMEFEDAIEWYDLQSTGLGERFKRTVLEQLRTVRQHPGWYVREDASVFVAYIPKFPYKIYYTFDEEQLVVWAIAHMHRKPFYWQERVK